MGRHKKYTEEEVLQKNIDEFFAKCDENNLPYTMSGLAQALGMDRRSLLNYSKDEKFFPTINKARLKCEVYAEQQLFLSKNTGGVIFNMTNNYGWKNKAEQEVKAENTNVNFNAENKTEFEELMNYVNNWADFKRQ